MFVLTPEHTVLGLPASAANGVVPVTFTVTEPVPVQLLTSVTVKLYAVVEDGVAVKLVSDPPLVQLNVNGVVPPDALALIVTVCPLHIVVALVLGLTLGFGFTVTTTELVAVQPELVTVTV